MHLSEPEVEVLLTHDFKNKKCIIQQSNCTWKAKVKSLRWTCWHLSSAISEVKRKWFHIKIELKKIAAFWQIFSGVSGEQTMI